MNAYQDLVGHFIHQVGVQSPIFLVWLGGILWACLTWKRHPRKSFLVVLVLGTFLIEGFVAPVAWHYLITRYVLGSPPGFERIMLYVQIAFAVFRAALWLLLLAALFMDEGTTAIPRGPDGEKLPPDWSRSRGAKD